MRRRVYGPLAVLVGLALAGLSAITWHDGSASVAEANPDAHVRTGPNHIHRMPGQQRQAVKKHSKSGSSKAQRPPRLLRTPPQRLVLPSIGVSASVSPIGTDGSLTLTPPADYTTVGWWAAGARPGDGYGTTIITGHTVHTGGGALNNLAAVKVGDRVTLQRGRQNLRYTITSVKTYRKGLLASKAGSVFDQTGPERLAIVTCADYNGEIYLSNTVAIASNPRPVPRR